MTPAPRRIAIFDFDGTLVAGDSLPRFVAACVGWPRALGTASIAAATTLLEADRRTAFKTLWLRLALKHHPVERMPQAVAALQKQLRWLDRIRERLVWHKERGDTIAVASGGLDLYLPAILQDLGVDHLLCTEMAVADGRVTGLLKGNCVRQEKARRVAALIAATGPYDEIWAYGNAPHDLPMMELATHKIVV